MANSHDSYRCVRPIGNTILLVGLFIPGCVSNRAIRSSVEDLKSLQDADLQWSFAAGGDDVDAILDFWTDDAVMYAQGEATAVVGKKAIRKFIEKNRSQPEFKISWIPERIGALSPSDGYTAGTHAVTIMGSDGKPVDLTGHYVSLWRKDGNKWRCYLECWNASPVASQ